MRATASLPTALRPTSRKEREKWGTRFVYDVGEVGHPPPALFMIAEKWATRQWDPTGTIFIGPLNLKEEITLDRSHNSYAGTFTVDQYDTNGNIIGHGAGNVTAQRITVD